MKRKIGSIALSLFIITSVIVGSSGSVYAQTEITPQCSELDEFVWVITIGFLNSDKCDSSQLAEELATMEESYTEQRKLDILDKANDAKQSNREVTTLIGNTLLDSRSVAYHKGEAAAIETIVNGGTLAEAKNAANNSIEDYYTVKQQQLAIRWNYFVNEYKAVSNITTSNTNIDNGFVNKYGAYEASTSKKYDSKGSGSESGDSVKRETISASVGEENIQLVNGTTFNVKYINFLMTVTDGGCSCDRDKQQTVYINREGIANNGYLASFTGEEYGIHVLGTQDVSGVTMLSYYNQPDDDTQKHMFWDKWDDIEGQSTQMKKNLMPHVEQLYNASQNDSVSFDTYINPVTVAQEYSTDYSQNGYWAYAVAMAGFSGYSIPNMSKSASMTIRYKNETYEGMLFSAQPPGNGMWEVGKRYNPQFIGGTQYFVRFNDSEVMDLNDFFTIVSITDKEGNELESTDTRDFNYETIENESYEDRQQKISEVKLTIDELALQGSGGSTGSNQFDLMSWLQSTFMGIPVFVWLIGGIAALLAFSRR